MKKLYMILAMASYLGLVAPTFADTHKSGVDQNFVEKAVQGGLGEVQAAQLAQSKSQNTQVLNLANMLINDHSKVNNDLTEKANNIAIKVPSTLSHRDQQEYTRLNDLSGRAFEREYLQSEISDHENTIALFKFEEKNGKNSTLRNFASNTLPTLQNHLKMSKDALNALDNRSVYADEQTQIKSQSMLNKPTTLDNQYPNNQSDDMQKQNMVKPYDNQNYQTTPQSPTGTPMDTQLIPNPQD